MNAISIASTASTGTYSPTGAYIFLICMGTASAIGGIALLRNARGFRDRILANRERGRQRGQMRTQDPNYVGGPFNQIPVGLLGWSMNAGGAVLILISVLSIVKHD